MNIRNLLVAAMMLAASVPALAQTMQGGGGGGTLTAGANVTFSTGSTCPGGNCTISSSGGTAAAGGSNTQLQRNNAGALGGISGATTDGTSVTITSGNLKLSGATSGTAILNAPATGGGTLTLPAGTDTVAGVAATQTLTNKTLTAPVMTAPVLGTPASGTLTNATGLPISTGVSGLGTGVATALGTNVGTVGAPVVNGGALGTPSSGTLTNATGLPVSSGVSGLGTGVATALGTNVGSAGAPVVNGGALGTPSSGTLTNATGLPVSTGVSGLGTGVATALGTAVSGSGAICLASGSACGGGGGSGTVTSVATGACLTGGPITTTGTISGTYALRAVTGTTDTILSGDACGLVTYSNASPVAVTLPQATGSFGAGWGFDVQNKGAGSVTITPTTSTINGASTLVIPQNMGCSIVSDGTNYQVSACAPAMGVTGSGSLVRATSPTLVTPALGTPASATLTNATGLPISTGVSGLGTGVATALGSAVSGSGSICLSSGSACAGGGGGVTPNWLTGLKLATNTSSSVSITAGNASDSTNAASMTTSSTFYGSTGGAWTSGAGSSGSPVNKMGNGLTVASGTWYFVCMANNSGTPDFYFDTSSSCANRPSGISDTKVRVVNMFRTCTAVLCNAGASTSIAGFVQVPSPGGMRTFWNFDSATIGRDVITGSVADQTRSLQTLSVPTGFKVKALFSATDGGTSHAMRFMSPDEPDLNVDNDAGSGAFYQPPDAVFGSAGYYRLDYERMTNASAQVALRVTGAISSSLTIWIRGYEWDRGMNGP